MEKVPPSPKLEDLFKALKDKLGPYIQALDTHEKLKEIAKIDEEKGGTINTIRREIKKLLADEGTDGVEKATAVLLGKVEREETTLENLLGETFQALTEREQECEQALEEIEEQISAIMGDQKVLKADPSQQDIETLHKIKDYVDKLVKSDRKFTSNKIWETLEELSSKIHIILKQAEAVPTA